MTKSVRGYGILALFIGGGYVLGKALSKKGLLNLPYKIPTMPSPVPSGASVVPSAANVAPPAGSQNTGTIDNPLEITPEEIAAANLGA